MVGIRSLVLWALAAAVLIGGAVSVSWRAPKAEPLATPSTRPPSSSVSVPPISGSIVPSTVVRTGPRSTGGAIPLPPAPAVNATNKFAVLPLLLFLLAGAGLLLGGYRWLSARPVRPDWDRDSDPDVDAAADTVSLPGAVADHLGRTAADRRLLLIGDDPRTGVRRAWMDVQQATAQSGIQRHPSETSSEFTGRVLSRWAVEPADLETLASAFREAEFSVHPIDEPTRNQVLAALARIERAVGVYAPTAAQ